MTEPTQSAEGNGVTPDTIDLQSDASVQHWAKKLDSTEMQVRDAVKAAGTRATDVEMYLKGSRSSTNTDRVEEVDGKS